MEIDTKLSAVLGEFALKYITVDILEIGCGVSTKFLSDLAEKYDRKVYHCDLDTPTIAYIQDSNLISKTHSKVYYCSSNEMFAKNELSSLAFAFIDGDHSYTQSKKDFWNTYNLLNDNGFILLHDSYPPTEEWVGKDGCGSCGDVYLLRQELEKDNRFDVLTFVGNENYIASTLIRKKPSNLPYYQE